MNAFPIYTELRATAASDFTRTRSGNSSGRRSKHGAIGRVSSRSMLLCGVVYALAGVFGYCCFLDQTRPNLLRNFPVAGSPISPLMDVLRIGFGMAVIFSYPVMVWEARCVTRNSN